MAYNVLVSAPEKGAAVHMSYALAFGENAGISWRFVFERDLCLNDAAQADLLILYRCTKGSALTVARFARKRGMPVVYELDDDLLNPPDDETWGKFWKNAHLNKIIRLFLAESVVVKAGSKELARRLRSQGFPTVFFPYPVKARPQLERPAPPFRVGYFGTPHHAKDIGMILPALILLEKRFPRETAFEFIGCRPEGWRRLKNVGTFPYIADYSMFLNVLAERRWALGLAPLRTTQFNEAKSDSKFRDFAAAGILGIYSNVAPYRESVIHEKTGWLTENDPEEWYSCITEALFSSDHAPMVKLVREQIEARNSPSLVAHKWLDLFEKISKGTVGDDLCLAEQ